MIYMTSSSSSTGTMMLTVFFDIGTDPDIAQVQVQNRVNIAQPYLPNEVIQNGLQIEKRSSSILMLIGIYGTGDRYTRDYINNYANVYVLDAIKRVKGARSICRNGQRQSGNAYLAEPGPHGFSGYYNLRY